MRAFIFSLDAFVAFTLALVAIYSLIFFSSVPSAYYYLLTQGHYLSRDTLLALSTTKCTGDYGVCTVPQGSLLDNIVAETGGTQSSLVQYTVGKMIPPQFGYVVEMSQDQGSTWNVVYDTASNPMDPHAKDSKKLTVTTQVITFGYSGQVRKLTQSPYNYLTCQGEGYGDNGGSGGMGGSGGNGSTQGGNFGTITCGSFNSSGSSSGGNGSVSGNGTVTPLGNTNPSTVLGGDIIPASSVSLVRLTVYI